MSDRREAGAGKTVRSAVAVAVAVVTLVGAGRAGAQQVPYDAGKTLIFLGTALADAQGNVVVNLSLPEQTTEGYEVIAAGIAAQPTDVDVPYSVLATIGAPLEGAQELAAVLPGGSPGLADGEIAAAVLPTAVERSISASAAGFRPQSVVRFSVRFAAAGTDVLGNEVRRNGVGSGALPSTGADIASSVMTSVVAIVVGSGLVAAAVGHRRRLRSGPSSTS